jgi:16S rRNA (adenine1518-N6/adenine1519-N6)-dimethyltransferase
MELVHGDVLQLDPADWFAASYVVVANVPYYIRGHPAAPAERAFWPRRLVLTVQREVADRLTARPPEMSLLAVSVQYYGRVRLVSTVKAGAFWPRPEVDSAVVGSMSMEATFSEQAPSSVSSARVQRKRKRSK